MTISIESSGFRVLIFPFILLACTVGHSSEVTLEQTRSYALDLGVRPPDAEALKNNLCLDQEELERGRILPSDYYLNQLADVQDSIECSLDINACRPFGREPESFLDQNAEEVAAHVASLVYNNIVDDLGVQFEGDLKFELALDDISTQMRAEISVLQTSLDALSESAELFGAIFTTRVLAGRSNRDLLVIVKSKLEQVSKQKIRTAVAQRVQTIEKKRLEGVIQSLEKVAKLERRMKAKVSAGERRGLTSVAKLGLMDKLASRARRIKSSPKLAALLAVAGFKGLPAALAVGAVIEGAPLIKGFFDGDFARGQINGYRRCDLQSSVNAADAQSGHIKNSDASRYYSRWRPQFKNRKEQKIHDSQSDKSQICPVLPILETDKLENLTDFGPRLTKDLAIDPNICTHVEELHDKFKVFANNRQHVLNCGMGKVGGLHSVELHIGGDPTTRALFGSPIEIQYKEGLSGRWAPEKIIPVVEKRPDHLMALNLRLKEIRLGPAMGPATLLPEVEARERERCRRGTRGQRKKCVQAMLERTYYPEGGQASFGRSILVERCPRGTGGRLLGRCQSDIARNPAYRTFATEMGYSRFFEGVDPLTALEKLPAGPRQFSQYARRLTVQSRLYNQIFAEAGLCCSSFDQPGFGASPLGHYCADKYQVGVERPQTIELNTDQ